MDYSSHIVSMTRGAMDTLFRTARSTSAEKLDWKPSIPDITVARHFGPLVIEPRSILEILQDAAQRSLTFASVLAGEAKPFTMDMFPAMAQERAQWTTIEECEAKAMEGLEAFYEVLLAVEDFDAVLILPYGGKQTTKASFSLMPLQTLTYMNGQVNYIQTLFGDYDRH